MAIKKVTGMAVDKIVAKMGHLKAERSNWETHWQEVADHILPRKNTVIRKQSDGNKRQFILLDNTGMHSNELLAGALHGLLTNPNAMWFEMTTGDFALDNKDNVRMWLQNTVRQMHNVLNNSNFQTEIHELYIDLCSFGTGCMQIEEDEKAVIRFSTKFVADYYIDENSMGTVDQIYREWTWDAAKIVAEFGEEGLPREVVDAFKKGDETKFKLAHAVYPKSVLGENYTGGMKYISQYVLPTLKHELKCGEFADFPYVVPRWTKACGEKYGRSPGMNALPEIKVLNKMNETLLIGAQKVVDPPLQLPDDGFILPLITRPGGLNFYRAGTQDFIKPVFNDTRIDFGYQAMEDRRKRVRDTYFIDQLQMQAGGPTMTATEVLQRTEEKMRLLGPMLGRQQAELLRPMIDRVFMLMHQRGMIDKPPTELQGRRVDVKYSSLIAKSQRVSEAQSILRTIQAAGPFIQMDPAAMDNFDADKAIRVIAGTYGLPQEIIKDQKDVIAVRDSRAKAQQAAQQKQEQAQMMQNAPMVAKTVKDLGQ
jgi:hypothetical protein